MTLKKQVLGMIFCGLSISVYAATEQQVQNDTKPKIDRAEQQHRESEALREAVAAQWESRKRISPEHLEQLISFESSFEALLETMDVEAFYRKQRETVLTWLKQQDVNDPLVRELSQLLSDIMLVEVLDAVYHHQQLSSALLSLSLLYADQKNETDQSVQEQLAVIKAIEGVPAGITDPSFVSLFSLMHEVITTKKQEKLVQFYSAINSISYKAMSAIDRCIKLIHKQMDTATAVAAKQLLLYYTKYSSEEAKNAEQEEQSTYEIMYPIVVKVKSTVQDLQQQLNNLFVSFNKQVEVMEASDDTSDRNDLIIKAYQVLLIQLKKYTQMLATFATINGTVSNQSPQQLNRNMNFFLYASQAYDLFSDFFTLYRDDCWDKQFKECCTGVLQKQWAKSMLFPWIINASFFAANASLHYKIMSHKMSTELLSPFMLGEGRQQAQQFSTFFSGKIPAIEGQIKLPILQGVKVNAAWEVAKGVGMHKLNGFTSSSRKLSSVGMMLGGSSYTSFLAKRLIIDALYYNTAHQKFVPANGKKLAGLTSYKPWVTDILNCAHWAAIRFSDGVESLLYQTLSINSLDALETISLGIATPELVSKLIIVGKDGLMANRSLKPWFDKVAVFNQQAIYGRDFHDKFHPASTDSELFAAYADRELFSYGIGCLAKFVASGLIKRHPVVVGKLVKKLAGMVVGCDDAKNLDQGAKALELVLTQGLAVILGGEHSLAYEDCIELVDIIKTMNEEWAHMAKAFLAMVGQGRNMLLAGFGLREVPGDELAVNKQLLKCVVYKFFVFNPLNVRVLNAHEISEIFKAYAKDPKDITPVAQKIVEALKRNVLAKVGGFVCGKVAEWGAKRYWNSRSKPLLFGRSIRPAIA